MEEEVGTCVKHIITLFLIVFSSASVCLGQGFMKFDCVVATLNLDSAKADVIAKQPVKEVARFKLDGIGEEQRINRYFRLPKTEWFIVASLYSTDESLASINGADSLDMELSLARRRRRNIFVSPAYASAEAPVNSFDVARVTMIANVGGHRQLVVLECIGSR